MFLTAFSLPLAAGLWAQVAVSSQLLARADWLYFHRHQAGHLEESIALLEGQQQRPEVLWRLGRSLLRLGERSPAKKEKLVLFSRAEDLARRSAEAAPNEAQAHFWLGVAMGRAGQTRGMLRSIFVVGPLRREMREVLRLDPGHAGAHHVLGEMLFEIPAIAGGSKKGAVLELEKAAELSPDYSSVFPDLAEAYLAIGERDKAKAALEHVFSIKEPADPAEYDEDVREARKMLAKSF
jgi:tetratricopeptide (TPR) repeat protein